MNRVIQRSFFWFIIDWLTDDVMISDLQLGITYCYISIYVNNNNNNNIIISSSSIRIIMYFL